MSYQFAFLALCIFSAPLTHEQAKATPSFDSASLNLAASDTNNRPDLGYSVEEKIRFVGGPGTGTPGRIKYSGVTLRMLLKKAYGLKQDQIVGPRWIDQERYDLAATLAADTNLEQFRLMLQNLLTERFSIEFHRVNKQLPVYLLTISNGGTKLEPAEKVNQDLSPADIQAKASEALRAYNTKRETDPQYKRYFHLPNATLARFAEVLSTNTDLPVKDSTGLAGSYAFTLKWTPLPQVINNTADGILSGPTLFIALEEQLGLKLKRGTDKIEVLVIDHAQKIPVSN